MNSIDKTGIELDPFSYNLLTIENSSNIVELNRILTELFKGK